MAKHVEQGTGLVSRRQYPAIPSTVEYTPAERGQALIPALEEAYR